MIMVLELLQDHRRPWLEMAVISVTALCFVFAVPTAVQADGLVIDGQITGPVTNSGTLDFLAIRVGSVINGDVTNTVEGEIGTATGPRPAVEISYSTITGALRNAGRIENGNNSGFYLWDARIGGGIINSGLIDIAQQDGVAVIDTEILDGGIVNSGSIAAERDGIAINVSNLNNGGIVNSGAITARSGGIVIFVSNIVDDGVVNSGMIDAGYDGISTREVHAFDGGIVNSGSIISRAYGSGISVGEVDNFQGGIANTSSIDSQNGIGIIIRDVGTLEGGIANSGTISAAYDAISLGRVSTFDGGIVNSGSVKHALYGIQLWEIDTFDGGIFNSGSIETGSDRAQEASSIDLSDVRSSAITADDIGTFVGGIVNSGVITAEDDGIKLFGVDNFDGDIINSGSIETRSDRVWQSGGSVYSSGGINISLSNFRGNLVNSGSIDAGNYGLSLSAGSFDGNVDNTGSILSRSASGIRVSADTFTGAITNSGSIKAAGHGIHIDAPVRGGIWNSGAIKGGLSAINVEDGLAVPTVINLTGGAIYGDILLSGTESDTVNVSGGLLDGSIDGTKGPRDDRVNFLIDGKTLFFGGRIRIRGVDRVFVNNGTLVLEEPIIDTTTLVLSERAQVSAEAYTQNSGATLAFIIGPDGSHGHLGADRVNLAGDLQILFDAGPLYPDRLTFNNLVSWKTHSGTFNPIAPESVFLSVRQDYQARSLSVTQERIPFNAYGQTSNQYAVGTGLERGYRYPAPNAEAVAFYTPLFDVASTGDYLQLLDTVSGSTYANTIQATINTSQVVNGAVQHRLNPTDSVRTVATAAELSLWAQALGVWGDADGDQNAAGFDQTTSGVAFGLDHQMSDESLMGVLGAYLADHVDFEQGSGKTDIDTWQIGAYAQHDTATWYANGILTFGWNDYDGNRRITFGGESNYAEGSYDGTALALYGEAGYKYPIAGGVTLKPMLGLGYVNVDTDGFTEKGASRYNLRVKGGSGESFGSNLGLRASLEHTTGNGKLITGEAQLSWQHEFLDDHQTAEAKFAAVPDTGFEARGSKFGRDSAVFGLGFKVQMADQSELFLNWNGRFGSDYLANSLFAGARYHW